jgi:hypothetical protein
MKKSAGFLCVVALVVASVPESGQAALQVTNSCDPDAVTQIETLKQHALDDLRALRDDIAGDPSLGDVSDPLVDLNAAIDSFAASLELIRGKDPCTISATEEIETLLEGIDAEEVGIESGIDFTSEDFGNDEVIPERFAERAEAAVLMSLAGDETFAFALLSRVAGQLSPGSGSGSSDPVAALAAAKALQDACEMPTTDVTRETDGTCDDASGAYADGIIGVINGIIGVI